MATNKLEIDMLSEMVRDNALTRVAGLVGEPRKELSQPSLLILACVTQPEFDPQAANARKLQLHDGTFTAIVAHLFGQSKANALQACRFVGHVVRHDIAWVEALEQANGIHRLRELTRATDAAVAAAANEALEHMMGRVQKHQSSSLHLVKTVQFIQSMRRRQLARRATLPLLQERNGAANLIFLLLRRCSANKKLRSLIDEKYAPLRAEHAAKRAAMADRLQQMEEEKAQAAEAAKAEEKRRHKERTEAMRSRLRLGVAITSLAKPKEKVEDGDE